MNLFAKLGTFEYVQFGGWYDEIEKVANFSECRIGYTAILPVDRSEDGCKIADYHGVVRIRIRNYGSANLGMRKIFGNSHE